MLLSFLILGPRQPGNNIDVYLAPLIEDLKLLWEVGIEAFDELLPLFGYLLSYIIVFHFSNTFGACQIFITCF